MDEANPLAYTYKMDPVAIDSDWLPWCKSMDMYITREELRDRILSGTQTIIVDVRDDDHQGGHIINSIHMPDGGDWSLQMPRLLSIINECLETSGLPVTVLFHCMESIRRGPRCARRLFQELKMSGKITDEKLAMPVAIKVLQGGADQWMRNFYSDAQLVEDYNNDIWGYLDD